ncbi:MAG: hypothetical protein KGL39_49580 [Patescibacteria group bacterium]|nr:hypothetical protein [Patescibacteria group bacterium]
MRITRVLTLDEHRELSDYWKTHDSYYSNDARLFTPGMAWYEPWIYDPLGAWKAYVDAHPDRGLRTEPMITAPPAKLDSKRGYLSPHYWRDWSTKRPPITVVGPNGEWWTVDRWSSNGDGWTVTGDLPDITCSPSIVLKGYHGYLRGGEFGPDLEGRGPNGVHV